MYSCRLDLCKVVVPKHLDFSTNGYNIHHFLLRKLIHQIGKVVFCSQTLPTTSFQIAPIAIDSNLCCRNSSLLDIQVRTKTMLDTSILRRQNRLPQPQLQSQFQLNLSRLIRIDLLTVDTLPFLLCNKIHGLGFPSFEIHSDKSEVPNL